MMLSELKGVEPLQGAKVLYLDDSSQFQLKFLTNLTLATRRRIERIYYHGESVEEIVCSIRERMKRCPSPHLLIVDGRLDMLPSLEPAPRGIDGYDVVRGLAPDLLERGIVSIGFSTTFDRREPFLRAGADGFVRKTIPAESAVEAMASKYRRALARIRCGRDREFSPQD
ncbi:MAG: hypothetical protein PHE68_03790 [Candidatus Peribacteraceae bacterium]|nr:hypothetical protein [Candidatus Peribacteraceae bacterium]MDD5075185.1 hypothetical protein [Candidatus Peribacteraceae bacterium]